MINIAKIWWGYDSIYIYILRIYIYIYIKNIYIYVKNIYIYIGYIMWYIDYLWQIWYAFTWMHKENTSYEIFCGIDHLWFYLIILLWRYQNVEILSIEYYIWIQLTKHNIIIELYMGCHPSQWRTHIFQDGYCTTNQILELGDDHH